MGFVSLNLNLCENKQLRLNLFSIVSQYEGADRCGQTCFLRVQDISEALDGHPPA